MNRDNNLLVGIIEIVGSQFATQVQNVGDLGPVSLVQLICKE